MSAISAALDDLGPLASLSAAELRDLCHRQAADNRIMQAELEDYRRKNLDRRMSQSSGKIQLRQLADIVAERREPEWLVHRVLEWRVLAVLAGPRSTFKSFLALHWTMKAVLDGHPAVILSGEGAGLDRRVDAWMRIHGEGRDLALLPVVAVEKPLNLNLQEEIDTLNSAVEASAICPSLVVIDTFSKFAPGLDENSNAEVAAFLSRLSTSIREFHGCTVLLVAHSGHGDSKRPRGASALMANPDAEYIVTRPDATAMTITVSRERFKDCPAMEPLAYEAKTVDLGRVDRYGEPVTSLVLAPTDAPTTPAFKPQLTGVRQRQLLAELRERQKTSEVPQMWSVQEMRAIGRSLGMPKSTAKSAVDALVCSPLLVSTIGGCRLADD